MPAPVVHFEIGCKDIAKTSKFYGELLGWEYHATPPGMPMAMVSNLGMAPDGSKVSEGIGGHLNSLGHPPHQYVTIYAMVDDIEATLAKAEKLGGATIVPKQEVPGMGWFAWFRDPEGNCIGLWKVMKR